MFWCYIWCTDPDSNCKTLSGCRKLVQLHRWTTWLLWSTPIKLCTISNLFLQEFIYKNLVLFFFCFLHPKHTYASKTRTAGRKETIKRHFFSSPVFITIFTQKMYNPCILLRLIGHESHWEQFKSGRCVFQPLKGFSLIIKQEATHWSVLSWCLSLRVSLSV